MTKTIGDYKADGKTYLRLDCACGRLTWLPWEHLKLPDETVPASVLNRFRCQLCGKSALSARGVHPYDGFNSANMYTSSN